MSTAKKEKQPKKPSVKPQGGEKSSGGHASSSAAGGKGKQQPKPNKGPDVNEDVKREQKLQAILLADSFSKTFRPVTLECPKVLLPLVNVPMLDYTIEFLAQNGVEEIFVFCVWHADKIEQYVKERKLRDSVSIRCISSPACSSAGDALREMDAMNIIRSDPFILISGDVISNLDLKKAIAYHKQKRKEDANCIMTVVLKKVQKRCASVRPILDDLCVGMNRASSQIVIFDDSLRREQISFPVELMEDANELVFYDDMLDCHVDICSPELILQFSDNFDYQDIRHDFIQNEVSNFSLGKHIYGYMLQDEYAARVQDPRTYHTISRDIVTRWVYPLVPEIQLLQDGSYSQQTKYVYKESNVKVSRTAQLVEGVVIGGGAVVGDRAVLRRCTIGRNVVIGSDAEVSESHIWKDVVVESGAKISGAIVCEGCVIGSHAVIPRGCVISYGVIVQPHAVLKEFTRVYKSDGGEKMEGTNGQRYVPDESIWGEEMEVRGERLDRERALRMTSIGCEEEQEWRGRLWQEVPRPVEEVDSEEEDFGEEEEERDGGGSPQRGEAGGMGDFVKAVEELVLTACKESHDTHVVQMEVMSMKFAQNKTFGDCLRGVMGALLRAASGGAGEVEAMPFLKKLKEVFKEGSWGSVVVGALKQSTGPAEEVEVIEAVEDFVLSHGSLKGVFRFILQVLHEGEVLSDQGVLMWSGEREDEEGEDGRSALFKDKKTQEFIEWIQEESDDEDEDEKGSEEEEEDDDDGED